MMTKYCSESPFTFVMFSEVPEAACEECDNNDAPTDEDRIALSVGLEKELTEDCRHLMKLISLELP